MNSYHYGRRDYNQSHEDNAPLVIVILITLVFVLGAYLLTTRFHVRPYQLVEISIYFLSLLASIVATTWYLLTQKARRENTWPHAPVYIPLLKDEDQVRKAFHQKSVVLGYNVHRRPWLWSDEVRVMQALLAGQSGAGKTTLLRNIITQDVRRVVGFEGNLHRIPMIIFDGKGDQEFLASLLPEIAAAGRIGQLRILDPSRPDISARYNPFYSKDNSYQEHVNLIFQSFALREDFFHGHQATYLSDLARVLWHTGKRFNIHDVLVMALDQQVMREQILEARYRIEHLSGSSQQQRLNFEMSVRNLQQSFQDRERVPKIQGLLNELMTFLEDDLSIITGPYEDLLTLDDIIDQELILFVSLNVNRNSRAVTALGRILLQNLQLMVGKRYQNERERRREGRPIVSVTLDEFAPFAYPNFAQILQTARGTNTAFLFSLQSISQLLSVSRGFRDDVSSAPNTIMLMRTRDEETAQYFLKASSRITGKRRTLTVQRKGVFQKKYEEIGFGSETEIRETRSHEEHIKNLPVGQMEILMTDNRLGTLHSHLHVRRPAESHLKGIEPMLFPCVTTPNALSHGANLHFKDSGLAQRYARINGRGAR
ncbi:MAG: type IV secretory system conjugative DNA transfer family protein [Candidatus Angelobacter sp.]